MTTALPAALALAGATPISNPAAFDVFKLDGLYSPPCKITQCNGRQLTWQEQQAPGLTGAFVVFRGEKLVSVTYRIELYSPEMFAKYKPIETLASAAKDARPPRGMKLADLRLAAMKIPQVALAKLPHLETVSPGLWAYEIEFQEYKRLNLWGGPVQPPRNPTEVAIAAAERRVAAKHRELGDTVAGQNAAAAQGK